MYDLQASKLLQNNNVYENKRIFNLIKNWYIKNSL